MLRWPAFSSDALTPPGPSAWTLENASVAMSRGGSSSMMAARCCSPSSAFSNSRAASSSNPSTRIPVCGPSFTSAGLLPKNAGVVATVSPLTTVKCNERWWPSTRQPHVPSGEGLPNTEK